jgi:GT2 family glycosyltransferase
MRTTIGIASLARPRILHETVLCLLAQSFRPDEILICVPSSADCLDETKALASVRVVVGPRGLTLQRNCILGHLRPGTELIAFFDDDVELHHDYMKNSVEFIYGNPDVVALSGVTLADGETTGEIPRSAARPLLENWTAPPDANVTPRFGLYGCNMVIRSSIAAAARFDERLHLYALFEDLDFGERCKAHGPVVTLPRCALVHLAARSGRISPQRYGFAQVMNLLYCWRKGSLSRKSLVRLLRKVLLANLVGLVIVYKKKSRFERVRRLMGNLRAACEFCILGACPERVSNLRD